MSKKSAFCSNIYSTITKCHLFRPVVLVRNRIMYQKINTKQTACNFPKKFKNEIFYEK